MVGPASLLRLLQVTDSGFPTGAFAFSHGLEGLHAAGVVQDEQDVAEFVALHVAEGFAGVECPAMVLSWRAGREQDLTGVLEMDALVSALKPAPAFRRGSVRTGRGLLQGTSAFLSGPTLDEYRNRVLAGDSAGHHAVAFGAVMACAGIEEATAAVALGASIASGLTAAAVRLGVIGQGAAQRVLAEAHSSILAAAERGRGIAPDEMGAFMPVVDVAGLRQPRLQGRIFAS